MPPALTTQAFFDAVGMRYQHSFGHDPGLIDFIIKALTYLYPRDTNPPPAVLDVGQGTGRPVSIMLAEAGCRVHGIDLSPVMVDLACRQVPSVTFEVADMLHWRPPPGVTFDAVFAMFSHFQLDSSQLVPLVHQWSQWLKPGGLLFIGTMAADDFPEGSFVPDMAIGGGEVGRVSRWFMGEWASLLVLSRAGWQALLEQHGFSILHSEMTPFQAPPEAGCDIEPHYYLACQKTPA